MSTFKPDAGIPVLTEIIEAPAMSSVDFDIPTLPPEPAAPENTAMVLNTEQWEQLERELRERVMQQVMKRIDLALEQRVRDSLADVLQVAVDRLAAEIRSGLHQSVKDVVTRAVMLEVNATRFSKD